MHVNKAIICSMLVNYQTVGTFWLKITFTGILFQPYIVKTIYREFPSIIFIDIKIYLTSLDLNLMKIRFKFEVLISLR